MSYFCIFCNNSLINNRCLVCMLVYYKHNITQKCICCNNKVYAIEYLDEQYTDYGLYFCIMYQCFSCDILLYDGTEYTIYSHCKRLIDKANVSRKYKLL